jgi:uncharacterized protein (UPF0303 family)
MSDENLQALYDRILREESELQFVRFDDADAWRLGQQMRDAAVAARMPVAISIRRNGSPLFYAALEGATADNADWLRRKCAVVDRYEHASMLVGTQFRLEGKTFEADSRLHPRDYAAHGGAFPLRIRNVGVVGTIAVSGLPQIEDHDFVTEQIRRYQ